MGQTIAYESRTVELNAIYAYEHDARVLEFWDQPWRLTLSTGDANEATRSHVPDFLVLYADGPWFEEWKTDKRAAELVLADPRRYALDHDGRPTAPPAEEGSRDLGINYRLRLSSELGRKPGAPLVGFGSGSPEHSTLLSTNLEFLSDFFDDAPVAWEIRDEVLRAIGAKPGITLNELLGGYE